MNIELRHSCNVRRISTYFHSVSRADLLPDSSSSEPTSPVTDLYTKGLSHQYGTLQISNKSSEQQHDLRAIDHDDDGEEAVDFRLFASTKEHPSTRIVLRSPTPQRGETGFVIAQRPHGRYFTGKTTQAKSEQYRQAAISGEEVIAGLKTKYTGLALPWKVTVINSSDPSLSTIPPPVKTSRAGNKRTRKGKKTRLAIRKRYEKAQTQNMRDTSAKLEKEQVEKDKRNRKNRERKIKRRQKKRDEKVTVT